MLFLVVAKNPADLENAVATTFPNEHIQVYPGVWIISTDDSQTSKEIWERLVGTRSPTGLIVSFVGYFGRESSNIWEWIAAPHKTPHGEPYHRTIGPKTNA